MPSRSPHRSPRPHRPPITQLPDGLAHRGEQLGRPGKYRTLLVHYGTEPSKAHKPILQSGNAHQPGLVELIPTNALVSMQELPGAVGRAVAEKFKRLNLDSNEALACIFLASDSKFGQVGRVSVRLALMAASSVGARRSQYRFHLAPRFST